MRGSRWTLTLGIAAASLIAPAERSAAQPAQISPELRRQLEDALIEKASRNAAQRKISSRLLTAARRHRGQATVPGGPGLRGGTLVPPDGRVLVEVRGRDTRRLRDRIAVLGGQVVRRLPQRQRIRARLPLLQLEALAALDDVKAIRPVYPAFTRKLDTSQGDVAHRADQARAIYGVEGAGVTVGVLSDGVDALASLQASGDLPPTVTVLPGQAGSGSEGTAMLEILYDLAPGAQLLFATAFGGQPLFAANILALRDAGAEIIVDDVGYFTEAVFQDDDVAAAVDAVAADGVLYFSSAGNSGNLNDGTAGVWEGDFADSGLTIVTAVFPGFEWDAHAFALGAAENVITEDSPFAYTLQWSDAQGASNNDYDLFLVDPTGTILLDSSTDSQDGDDDPFELIDSGIFFPFDDTGNWLLVGKFSGEDRYLHLNANRGDLILSTDGQISGHPAARGALSVAAVDVAEAGGAGGVFDGSEEVEPFSSDGPRLVFFEADGTPITPGDFSSSGGELRQKPDLAAADGVSTATPGFDPFFGTSAAAPHAAGVAALMLELARENGLGPADVKNGLLTGVLDIEAPGPDRDSGTGLVDAVAAIAQLVPLDLPALTAASRLALALLLAVAFLCSARARAPGTRSRR